MNPWPGAVLMLLALPCAGSAAALEPGIAEGESIYRAGIGAAGGPVTARLRGGGSLTGTQAACASCHRRSGFGANEGRTVVPPIAGAELFAPRGASAPQLRYLTARPARRPAYTDVTLARAIRDGIDAAGRPLAAPMPRYDLGDKELAGLIEYLKSLAGAPAPGVDGERIHFATIVTEGVEAGRRAAMLEVLDAFVRDKNGGTRHERQRVERGPWTMTDYRAYRTWVLHVWELKGPPAQWPAQLAEHYARQPVFALLSGQAAGPWEPIHRFCAERGIPALAPDTDLPDTGDGDFYSLYLSRGMVLEAEALAEYFQRAPGGALLQLHADDARSAGAAHALASRADLTLVHGTDLAERLAAQLQARDAVRLAWWSPDPDLSLLAPWAARIQTVALSQTLLQGPLVIPRELQGKVVAVTPFVAESRRAQHLARVRAWLTRKGIARGDERAQANSFLAATLASDGLMQIGNHFSREYFVERIEDMVDDALTSSLYPRVSLGPGQRFMAKGAYVTRLGPAGEPEGAGEWIVPE